jgi:hypothetical protein
MPRVFTNTPASQTRDTPMNDRAVKPAVHHSIPHYAQMEKKRTLNALEAGQISATLYFFRKAGVKCTCNDKTPLLTSEGQLTQPSITQMLFTGATASKPKFTTDDLDLDNNLQIDLDDPNDDIDMELRPLLVGYDANACGCCYGSGYIGGFDIARHFFTSLATPSYIVAKNKMVIDSSTSPHSFVPDDDTAYVQFRLVIPQGSTFVTFRLMDNTDVIAYPDYEVQYQNGNSNWVSTIDLSPLNIGQPVDIRIMTDKTFTHFELLFSLNQAPIYIDFPQLQSSDLEKNLQGDVLETEMYLGPDAVGITKYSVLYDHKYKRLWELHMMTPHLSGTDRRETVFIDATARLIQPQELKALVLRGPQP